jgi:alpha-L-fucosidase
MTMNDTWGFKSYDQHWKSTRKLLQNLINCASKGGNYLLNVGPTAEGEIPPESVERLKEMGAWLRVNGEAIYGTSPSPFGQVPFDGRVTRKGDRLYLHVFTWPEDGKLLLPLKNEIKAAFLLTKPDGRLAVTSTADGKLIALPNVTPDPNATVVVVEIAGEPQVTEAGQSPAAKKN